MKLSIPTHLFKPICYKSPIVDPFPFQSPRTRQAILKFNIIITPFRIPILKVIFLSK